MKAKKGRVRLSPNEEARLMKEETEKRRRLRLQQVNSIIHHRKVITRKFNYQRFVYN